MRLAIVAASMAVLPAPTTMTSPPTGTSYRCANPSFSAILVAAMKSRASATPCRSSPGTPSLGTLPVPALAHLDARVDLNAEALHELDLFEGHRDWFTHHDDAVGR